MSRLTVKTSTGMANGGIKYLPKTADEIFDVLNKLGEYEDLEEQGLLLKLPCKVGDKLYKPYYFNRKAKGIDTIVVSNMVVKFDSEEGERAYIVGHYENTNCGVDADFSEIGEVVHIHKAEAEKALEEMEK